MDNEINEYLGSVLFTDDWNKNELINKGFAYGNAFAMADILAYIQNHENITIGELEN